MEIPGPEWRADGGVGAIADAGGLHLYQLRLHEAFGPVVRFQLPGADGAVSIADPVLLEATAHLDERPERLFAFLDPLFETGNPQVMPAGEHASWRRLLLSVLAGRPSHERYLPQFTALTMALADRWAEQAGGAEGDDGRPVGLQKDLTALSLRMICAYALGGEVSEPERVVSAFEDVLTAHLHGLYRTPGAGAPGEAAGRNGEGERAEAGLLLLRRTVDRVIAAHHGGRRGRSDVVGALVEAGEEPARIRDTVMAMMLAAHHTTGVAVSWALYLLSLHPRVTERVTGELDRVLGARAAPAYEDLGRLTYLEMVLKEAMRLCPPGPYGARRTDTALVVGAYGIPAGATVFYPFWAVHMNPAYWPGPREFRPERFTPRESAARPRLAHIPFGIGPRSCEGARLAMVEAMLILAVLLKRFRFRPVPGHEVVPVERFVLWAADDIRMTVSLRNDT
ncbi:cytochrome P450 [Streptomyces yaizuensis]|uniref:Cytochrome P450 n=1 Tax=Streptomyces yaizuensis TaxID=2989713 RepID=A0ABQ5NY18_9ACTN|nr:cytochrome P450 [Streptomyces sp. YSPA8]GLF95139.1 cytochrome P450 [Streptomyces sp. YSPA8]